MKTVTKLNTVSKYSTQLKSISALILLSHASSGCMIVQAAISGGPAASSETQNSPSDSSTSNGNTASKAVGTASELIITRLSDTITVGSPVSLKVTVADFKDNPVTNFTGTITLSYTVSSAGSTATLPVLSHAFSAAEQGVFIFSGIIFNNADNYTVIAANKLGQTVLFSNSITLVLSASHSTQSTDATLSALALSSGTLNPVFSSNTTSYTASITNATNSITVTSTATQAGVGASAVTVNGGSASSAQSMNVGSNTVSVLVTAPDGSTTKTYTITVTRAASSDATLSALSLSSGTLSPSFDSSTTSYTASISNGTNSITVTSTATQAGVGASAVTVNGGSPSAAQSMNVGSNTVSVLVTAPDGSTTKTYTITVTRSVPLSSDATLSGLSLSDGLLIYPSFSSATTSYSAIVLGGYLIATDNSYNSFVRDVVTPTISLKPTVNHANATVTVNGTSVTSGTASQTINLSGGDNTITTVVTAEDTTTQKTYRLTVHVNQGSVSTLAGSRSTANPGVDGTGTAASFYWLAGIVVDSQGNLLVTDGSQYVPGSIRKITPAGVVTTVHSGGYNYGLTIDASDNLYSVSYTGSGVGWLNSFSSDYSSETGWWSYNGAHSATNNLHTHISSFTITNDLNGNFYIPDPFLSRVLKINGPTVSVLAGGSSGTSDGTGAAAKFSSPWGSAIDRSNNLYVSDAGSIRKINAATGVVVTFAGGTSFGYYDGTGTDAIFSNPYGIACDISGNLYIADDNANNYGAASIRAISPSGVVRTLAGGFWGSGDGVGTNASFGNYMEGVAVDSTGNIYVTSTDGIISKVQ